MRGKNEHQVLLTIKEKYVGFLTITNKEQSLEVVICQNTVHL